MRISSTLVALVKFLLFLSFISILGILQLVLQLWVEFENGKRLLLLKFIDSKCSKIMDILKFRRGRALGVKAYLNPNCSPGITCRNYKLKGNTFQELKFPKKNKKKHPRL